MAVSTLTVSVYNYPRGFDNTQRCQIVRGTFVITDGQYPAGGYPIDWSTATNATGEMIRAIPLGGLTPTSTGSPFPINVDVSSRADLVTSAGTGPSGFVYVWDNVLGNLHIFVSMNAASANSGPLVELGGALPHTVVTDTIQFQAWFSRVD